MSSQTQMEYSNGEITVIWKPSLCEHAAVCVKSLPEVFKPNAHPWVQIKNASSEKIVNVVNRCPSGALSIEGDGETTQRVKNSENSPSAIRVKVLKNGPLLIQGNIELENENGLVTEYQGKSISLCRCGASGAKPFCDGSHKKIKFFG